MENFASGSAVGVGVGVGLGELSERGVGGAVGAAFTGGGDGFSAAATAPRLTTSSTRIATPATAGERRPARAWRVTGGLYAVNGASPAPL
jgi:hypothetical protein